MTPASLPPAGSRIHFVGIGGIGMSGLARLLASMGYTVSGSDSGNSALIDELRASGIKVTVGHDEANVRGDAGLLVRTSAVTGTNPEVQAAERLGIPIMRRAELLGAISSKRTTIAVAGTHGKSTTSGMLTSALRHLGKQPSYAIGAILHETGKNAEPGDGEFMVVEADEYDRSFLALSPAHAIVTNAEFDHPDIFDSARDYQQAFIDFVRRIRPGGTLIIRGDDEGAAAVLSATSSDQRLDVRTFGRLKALDWSLTAAGSGWRVSGPEGVQAEVSPATPGEHNALNALAVVAMLVSIGIDPSEAARAVEQFRGIGRRFERKGEVNGVLVIDDYAHHPTEVEATLRTALATFPGRKLWGVFQPHTYSRTAALLEDFANAFSLAEHRILLDIYGARETNDGRITESDLDTIAGSSGLRAKTVAEAVDRLAERVAPGDVVLTMGAGDVTAVGPQLLARLGEKRE